MSAEPSLPPAGTQERITAFWDMVAPHYESDPANVPPFESSAYGAWVELFRKLLPPPPSDLLDVATGTGFAALIAAELGHRVTGIDLSSSMLDIARARARDRQLNAPFVTGDAVAPPFPVQTFDVITNRFLLWTLREPDRALLAWHELLRPGGRLVSISVLCAPTAPGDDHDPGREDVFSRSYTPEVRQATPFIDASDHTALVSAIEDAGFTAVTLHELSQTLAAGQSPRPFAITASRP